MNLPPDPDSRNEARSEFGAAALQAGCEEPETEYGLTDVLANLAHYCDRNDLNLAEEISRAEIAYDAETSGEGRQFEGVAFDAALRAKSFQPR